MAKKTQTTENSQLSETSELSRVEWLKNGLSIGISYGKGDVTELDPKLAVELDDAGFVKILEAGIAPEIESAPANDVDADTL
jgi:hypothetical protein